MSLRAASSCGRSVSFKRSREKFLIGPCQHDSDIGVYRVVVRDGCSTVVVERSRTQRESIVIFHDVRTSVADRDVVISVGADHERVQAMIVIMSSEAAEKNLALVGLAVAVDIGVQERVRRARDEDALVADDADSQRRDKVLVLHEDRGLVGDAVAIRIFEHDHAIAVGM